MLSYMHQLNKFQSIWMTYIYFCLNEWLHLLVSGPTNAPTTPGLPLTTDRMNSIPRMLYFVSIFKIAFSIYYSYTKMSKKIPLCSMAKWDKCLKKKKIITVFIIDYLKKSILICPKKKDELLKTCFLSYLFVYLYHLFY